MVDLDDTLETCMRLSKRFQAKGLEMACGRYIRENVSPSTVLSTTKIIYRKSFCSGKS